MTDEERARRRALHLLERMDRTEKQLREKLRQGGYSPECVEQAVAYVKSYRYIDDSRYAHTYVRYRQDTMSRMQLRRKLLAKGIDRSLADEALEAEYVSDEQVQIEKLLEKRRFSAEEADERAFRRTYEYLLRRGFSGRDIISCMHRKSAQEMTVNA